MKGLTEIVFGEENSLKNAFHLVKLGEFYGMDM
jgi:hypothetical protein